MVPCQRRDWWAEELRKSCPRFYRLPIELFRHIIDMMDDESYPISLEDAQRMRIEFKQERERFRMKHTEAFEGYDEWDFYGEPGSTNDGSEE